MSKSGYVYVLINPSLAGLVKVGCSQRDPALRVKELSAGTGVPTPFHLAYKVRFADCAAAERHVHEILAEHRLSDKREFFKVPLE
ncbi:MAG: GIY-YIG nuclease family protein, partial [Actinomycetota bacterium]